MILLRFDDGCTHTDKSSSVGTRPQMFIDMQRCPNCGGGELKILAAIVQRPVLEKILRHPGLDPQPPPRGGAHEAGRDFAA